MGKTNCVIHGKNDVPQGVCADYRACLVQVVGGGPAICEGLLDWEARGEPRPAIKSRGEKMTVSYLALLEVIAGAFGGQVTGPVLAARMDVTPNTASKWLSRMAKRDMVRRAGKSGKAFVYRVAESFGGLTGGR